MFLSSVMVGLTLSLISKVLGKPRLGMTAPAAVLVVPPFAILVPLLLLGLNVNLLRYRYSPVSIATDLVTLLGCACLFAAIVRRISRSEASGSRTLASNIVVSVGLLWLLSSGWLFLGDRTRRAPMAGPAISGVSEVRTETASSVKAEESSKHLNLIIVSIDTLRQDHLGSYGYIRPTSPNLDAFAAEGIRFANAYSTAPWTLPSHHSLITGQYPSKHGADTSPVFTGTVDKLPEERITLAEVMKDAGYSTAAFTSADLLGTPFGFDQGFDTIDSRGRGEGLAGRWDLAKNWLDEQEQEPFLLFLHCFDVHGYQSPVPYQERFVRPYSGHLRSLYEDRRRFMRKVVSNGFYSLGAADIGFMIDLYDAAIAYVDDTFEKIRSDLEEQALWENSVVLVLSDHGEEFWDHGGTGHGFTFFEEQLRIPALLEDPRRADGSRD